MAHLCKHSSDSSYKDSSDSIRPINEGYTFFQKIPLTSKRKILNDPHEQNASCRHGNSLLKESETNFLFAQGTRL